MVTFQLVYGDLPGHHLLVPGMVSMPETAGSCWFMVTFQAVGKAIRTTLVYFLCQKHAILYR
jgi:hypothetical protein